MKITSILLLKTEGESEPILLGNASDLTNFGYFQRASVKEVIIFVGRTIAKRTPPGRRQSVEHEEYLVHCYNRNGLCGLVFANSAYPTRSAFSVINKVLDEYVQVKGNWQQVQTDCKEPLQLLEDALAKYQDPHEADKLLKIQKELDETKIILHKTIDSVLARGEKLDSLVDKSNDLSMASQGECQNGGSICFRGATLTFHVCAATWAENYEQLMFYKQAKKTNSCCTIL